jgi:hypothetical protein
MSRRCLLRSPEQASTLCHHERRRVLLVATVAGAALGIFSVLADGILPGRLFVTLGNLAALGVWWPSS